MLLPLYDKNPLRILPYQAVTAGLIIINILAHLYRINLIGINRDAFLFAFGLIPQVLWNEAQLEVGLVRLSAEMTLLSSLFLHSDFLHLAGNILFLWVFGDNVEESMGHWKFLVFYLLCGIGAGLTHAFLNPGSGVPLIGASGAIGGVLGAYLLLHPRVKVVALIFMSFPILLPAYMVLGSWLIIQIVLIVTDSAGNMAVWAHLGGFAVGVALIPIFKHSHIPLFDRGTEH